MATANLVGEYSNLVGEYSNELVSSTSAVNRVDVDHALGVLQKTPLTLGVMHRDATNAMQRLTLPTCSHEPIQ